MPVTVKKKAVNPKEFLIERKKVVAETLAMKRLQLQMLQNEVLQIEGRLLELENLEQALREE